MKREEGMVTWTARVSGEQPMPCGKGVDVANLVHEDLEARISEGRKKYGERLTTNNGRDTLLDLYQEMLDAVVYLRQVIYERDEA